MYVCMHVCLYVCMEEVCIHASQYVHHKYMGKVAQWWEASMNSTVAGQLCCEDHRKFVNHVWDAWHSDPKPTFPAGFDILTWDTLRKLVFTQHGGAMKASLTMCKRRWAHFSLSRRAVFPGETSAHVSDRPIQWLHRIVERPRWLRGRIPSFFVPHSQRHASRSQASQEGKYGHFLGGECLHMLVKSRYCGKPTRYTLPVWYATAVGPDEGRKIVRPQTWKWPWADNERRECNVEGKCLGCPCTWHVHRPACPPEQPQKTQKTRWELPPKLRGKLHETFALLMEPL